jgi:hypothetical protein
MSTELAILGDAARGTGVVDIMALLGRFPRGLADEGSPDPLDLDGARPARAVSRTAPPGGAS